MKILRTFAIAACASFASFNMASADLAKDLDLIVTETITEDLYKAGIQAQREMILHSLEHEFRQEDIRVTKLDTFVDLLVEEVLSELVSEMRTRTKAVYIELLSEDDIADIADFYRTPAGQALLKNMPEMTRRSAADAVAAGAIAGARAMPRLTKRIKEENIEIGSPTLTQKLLDALQ